MSRRAIGETIWSGLTQTFTKASLTDHTQAENQDSLTINVAFTRGDTGGLINFAHELDQLGYTHFSSPRGTEWATDLTTPETIAAENWQALKAAGAFNSWIEAFGGQFSNGSMIVGRKAVVHLISDNIYLDLQFTEWTNFRGGGFSYLRAVPPHATTGDYNGDLAVNAADYTVWRNTLGSEVELGTGADGHANSMIDFDDYLFWKDRIGNTAAENSQLNSAETLVPEPTSALLALVALAVSAVFSRH